MNTPAHHKSWLARPWVSALVVAGACALVYWPMLGSGGLTATEGHRAIPAWSMLDSGDWVVPRLLGQAYLRKPPGIQWAIALSSEVFGETEFAARAVSALSCTAMALVAWGFAGRWFGWRSALAGGLAQALMPWMWTVGRQAEIEALHTAMVQVACLGVVDVMMRTGRVRSLGAVLSAALIALGVSGMALTKGPAGAPALVGAFLGACLVRRAWRPAAWATVWVGIGLGAAIIGGVLFAISSALGRTGETPMVQSAGAFLFEPGRFAEILLLAPGAWAAMLPASIGLLFPWGPDARAEARACEEAQERWVRARGLTWAWVIAIGIYVVTGVGNVRYAMPAGVFVAPLVASVFTAWREGSLTRTRAAIARAACLGHPAVISCLLVVGAWGWITFGERALRDKSGREAGIELGEALLADGADRVWADDLVEARPEVLAYAERRVRAGGGEVEVLWKPGLGGVVKPPVGAWVVAREDAGSDERERVVNLVKPAWVAWAYEGSVHRYRFALGHVVGATEAGEGGVDEEGESGG